MIDELTNVKTIEECEEMATVDCKDEDECISGWFTCLEEVFGSVEKVKLFEEEINFKGFDFNGKSIVGVCQKGREKIRVDLDSLKFADLTKTQELWLKAWLKCLDNY